MSVWRREVRKRGERHVYDTTSHEGRLAADLYTALIAAEEDLAAREDDVQDLVRGVAQIKSSLGGPLAAELIADLLKTYGDWLEEDDRGDTEAEDTKAGTEA